MSPGNDAAQGMPHRLQRSTGTDAATFNPPKSKPTIKSPMRLFLLVFHRVGGVETSTQTLSQNTFFALTHPFLKLTFSYGIKQAQVPAHLLPRDLHKSGGSHRSSVPFSAFPSPSFNQNSQHTKSYSFCISIRRGAPELWARGTE